MAYHPLHLTVRRDRAGGYLVTAACADHPPVSGRSAVGPAALPDVQRVVAELEGEGDREKSKALARRLGEALFDALFRTADREILLRFGHCLGAAEGRRQDVLIRLSIDRELPELAALPWEYLYCESEAVGLHGYLAASQHTPVVRFTPEGRPNSPDEVTLPLRMLLLAPRYGDERLLAGIDAERTAIDRALGPLGGRIEVTALDQPVTVARVRNALRRDGPFQIVHFIGHGGWDEAAGRASLTFNADDGEPLAQSDECVGELFAEEASVRLVVLNSCLGAAASQTKPLAGMAQHLTDHARVPAVVAMRSEISNAEATCFAADFYEELAGGRDRGRAEAAAARARHSLLTMSEASEEGVRPMAVGVPVVYMRSRDVDDVLFEVLEGARVADSLALLPPRSLDTARVIARRREEHVEALRAMRGAAPDVALEREITEVGARLGRVRRRIRDRNVAVACALAVTLGVSIAASFGVLDLLPERVRLETYATPIADAFRPLAFDPSLAVVTPGEGTARARASRDTTAAARDARRVLHARLVDRLVSGGARAIAFGIAFPDALPRDSALGGAVTRAVRAGTAVVVGVDRLDGDAPRLAPALRAAGVAWGSTCLGTNAALSDVEIAPVLVQRGGPGAVRQVDALALRAVRAFAGAGPARLDARDRAVTIGGDGVAARRFPIAAARVVRQLDACPLHAVGDTLGETIFRLSPLARLRDTTARASARRVAYDDVLAMDDAMLRRRFAGTLVLVGGEADAGRRSPIEHHADAANVLLRGATLRPLGGGAQFLVTLAMAAAGAWLAAAPRGRRLRLAGLAAAAAAYFAVMIAAYAMGGVLMIAVYHVAALLLGYAAVRAAVRRVY